MKRIILIILLAAPLSFLAQDRSVEARESQAETTEDTTTEEKEKTAENTESNSEESEINWMTLEEALEAQKEEPRKIMMDVYTQWCGPCKMLDKNTFHNADVVEYVNENFYAVKFDAESADDVTYKGKTFENPDYNPEITRGRNSVHQLTRALGVSAYPTIIYMNEEGEKITGIASYLKPTDLEIYLKLFATDAYKEIDTKEKWEEYQATFVNEFEN